AFEPSVCRMASTSLSWFAIHAIGLFGNMAMRPKPPVKRSPKRLIGAAIALVAVSKTVTLSANKLVMRTRAPLGVTAIAVGFGPIERVASTVLPLVPIIVSEPSDAA